MNQRNQQRVGWASVTHREWVGVDQYYSVGWPITIRAATGGLQPTETIRHLTVYRLLPRKSNKPAQCMVRVS